MFHGLMIVLCGQADLPRRLVAFLSIEDNIPHIAFSAGGIRKKSNIQFIILNAWMRQSGFYSLKRVDRKT